MSQQPEDRQGIRSRAFAQAGFGAIGLAMGLFTTFVTGVDEIGSEVGLPGALKPVVVLMIFLVSGYCTLSALWWALVPLQGPRPAVVRFTPDRLEIRNPIVPVTLAVDRDKVVDVFLWHLAENVGGGLGMWPMVIVRTFDGRGRGVQHTYAGSAADLADEVAAWASVTRSESRRGLMALTPTGER